MGIKYRREKAMMENLLTRHYFNGLAEQWETKMTTEKEKIQKLLSRLELNKCNTLLDIGCGTGLLFPFLNKMTHRKTCIFAIDFAECMAQTAAQKDYNIIHVLCGCARYLPFRSNTFDCIIAFHIFPHIQGKHLALRECWRVLKPFGELGIIHLHSSEEINEIHQVIGGMVKDHKLPSGEQMCRMFQKINFEITDAVDRSGEYFVKGVKIISNNG